MKKLLFIILCSISFVWISCEEAKKLLDQRLTNEEIVEGLKEALDIGLNNAVISASAENGYLRNEVIKILLPEEVKEVQTLIQTESVKVLGIEVPLTTIYETYLLLEDNVESDIFEELIVAMNKGAESAATKALPIFGEALLNMSFTDALGILQGGEKSATEYFYNSTKTDLFNAFNPEVKNALDQSKANLIYESAVGFINYEYEYKVLGLKETISVSEVINVDLPETIHEYATEKAIDGLFNLVGEEEKKIRADPFAWASDIIEKVFSSEEAQGS